MKKLVFLFFIFLIFTNVVSAQAPNKGVGYVISHEIEIDNIGIYIDSAFVNFEKIIVDERKGQVIIQARFYRDSAAYVGSCTPIRQLNEKIIVDSIDVSDYINWRMFRDVRFHIQKKYGLKYLDFRKIDSLIYN